MVGTLNSVAQEFDRQGWVYRLDQDLGQLIAGFESQYGNLDLVVHSLQDVAVVLEVVRLGFIPSSEVALLLNLGWCLPAIGLARDRNDSEVRAQLLLPMDKNELDARALEIAVATILGAAEMVRAAMPSIREGAAPHEVLAQLAIEQREAEP